MAAMVRRAVRVQALEPNPRTGLPSILLSESRPRSRPGKELGAGSYPRRGPGAARAQVGGTTSIWVSVCIWPVRTRTQTSVGTRVTPMRRARRRRK